MFDILFYISILVFSLGMLYRVGTWFVRHLPSDHPVPSFFGNLAAVAGGAIGFFFSRQIFRLVRTLIWDILLQGRLLQAGLLRWIFHLLLFYAFLGLLFFHAMDDWFSRALFTDYESTLLPFLFARNLLGCMVLAGIVFFILRRLFSKSFHNATNRSDRLVLFLLGTILISGFFLEAMQISSEPIFNEMVNEYIGPDEPEEVEPLKAFWAEAYGVVFSKPPKNMDAEVLSLGKDLHAESCAACHSRPEAAFVSYPISKGLWFVAEKMNQNRIDRWVWYIHFLSCFLALACLPFSKFLHIITVPLQLLIRQGNQTAKEEKADSSMRRNIGIDACTHCGVCSIHCSVLPIYRITGNVNVLPSEKYAAIRGLLKGKPISSGEGLDLAEGNFACTDCYRCTQVCPSGIDLHHLWQSFKKELADQRFPAPGNWVRAYSPSRWAAIMAETQPAQDEDFAGSLLRNLASETFTACVQCTVCSNVCPVVSLEADLPAPQVTPHQVMNLLRLDLKDLAVTNRMVWDCTTCYMCQEHCPQGIRVADILYELRNAGTRRLKNVRRMGIGDTPDGAVEGKES